MTCLICHGEDIRVAEVKEEMHVGNDIVYVPVRVPVCRSCGERYYDRRTVRFLEDVETQLKEGSAGLQEVGRVLMYG